VLRSSLDRIRIGLAPNRVDLARLRIGRGTRPVAETSVTCERRPGEAPWQAALDALEHALPDFAPGGGSATVVLSNAFVRYLVVPWQPEISGVRELDELASLRFSRTFGEAAAGWTIRCSAGGYGEPTLACALDTALVEALTGKLRACKLRLVSLQPLLMAAYNDVRRQLAPTHVFATVEVDRLCVSIMGQGHWRHVVSRRGSADPAEVIEQELSALGSEAPPAEIDVLLVGDGVAWPEDIACAARLLGRPEERGVSLALRGVA
jgi:hypothetical protein